MIGAQIRYAREILQWCRVNQLDIPIFKAKNCIFIRDLQCGNYQHYFVSILNSFILFKVYFQLDRPHDLVLYGHIAVAYSYSHKHHRDQKFLSPTAIRPGPVEEQEFQTE